MPELTPDALAARLEAVEKALAARVVPPAPVWPDDQITRDWLAGIAAAREAADRTPDPWDEVRPAVVQS